MKAMVSEIQTFLAKQRVKKLLQTSSSLHLGCDVKKLSGFINVDLRQTSATDLVWDCVDLSPFPTKSIDLIFTSAFLEHLYLQQRPVHLQECARLLKDTGILFEANIPYFPVVAKQYLSKGKGIFKKQFDLEHVYHYTHGMPEAQPTWWLAQLHKSLFDRDSLKELLEVAGFKHYLIVNHCWGDEKIPVTCSFLASKNKKVNKRFFVELAQKLDSNINTRTAKVLASN